MYKKILQDNKIKRITINLSTTDVIKDAIVRELQSDQDQIVVCKEETLDAKIEIAGFGAGGSSKTSFKNNKYSTLSKILQKIKRNRHLK